jgi:hypothetical protein
MSDYESWRKKGFEPQMRTMACADLDALIDCSWTSVAPRAITIDVQLTSKGIRDRTRSTDLLLTYKNSLVADQAVKTLGQDAWSPEHSVSKLK